MSRRQPSGNGYQLWEGAMFENDVFISYSHRDNQLVPGWKEGWVSELHQTLKQRVGTLLGKDPRIWRDSQQAGNVDFTADFLEQLRKTAVLVSILSPSYFNSPYCPRELEAFCKACESSGGLHVGNHARIFKVLKTQIPELERLPPPLHKSLVYEFFSVDEMTERVREYWRVFGEEAGQKFIQKVDDLAQDISRLLRQLTGLVRPPRGSVYLALTTSDLKEARESLRRDLDRSGYAVLPDGLLLDTSPQIKAAVCEDLARCQLSIHMIGRNYGTVPEEGELSLPELQNDLAAERSRTAGLPRLVWFAPGQPVENERQKAFIHRLQTEPELQGRMDPLEGSLEDLKNAVYRALAPRPEPPAPGGSGPGVSGARTAPSQVYLICHRDDRDQAAVEKLRDLLYAAGCEPTLPLFEGDETEMREDQENNLRTCAAVLFYWGAGNEAWRRRKQSEVQKSAGLRPGGAPLTALYVAPPMSRDKENLRTHVLTLRPAVEEPTAALLAPFLVPIQGREA